MAVEPNPPIITNANAQRGFVGEFPAQARSVRAAREAIADFARAHGADPACVEDVRLAISEAATNVVVHAYAQSRPSPPSKPSRPSPPSKPNLASAVNPPNPPNPPSTAAAFRVLADVGNQRLLVVVEDNGCGLSTPAKAPGLGAGMRVMNHLADEATFLERDDGGSTVQLSFRLVA